MVFDHEGNGFGSVVKMCDHYGVNMATYYYRKRAGYSLEQILTYSSEQVWVIAKTKFVNCPNPVEIEDRTDHLGNVYISKTEMCKAYGISRQLYLFRLEKGWSKERALGTASNPKKLPKEKRTVNGIEYRNVQEMCEKIFENNICERQLLGYLNDFDEPEQAIRYARKVIRHRKVKKLKKKVLIRYGITEGAYNQRRYRGMGIIEAISTPLLQERLKEGRTYGGITYPTQEDMCREHGMEIGVYRTRRYRGTSQETALKIPVGETASMGEREVGIILQKLCDEGIIESFSRQKSYGECKDKQRLQFDFCIFNDNKYGLIEFDGKQHFIPTCFWAAEEEIRKHGYNSASEAAEGEYLLTRKHDIIKNEYCYKNEIPLLRIRYEQQGMMRNMIIHFVENMDKYIEQHNMFIANEEYFKDRKHEFKQEG